MMAVDPWSEFGGAPAVAGVDATVAPVAVVAPSLKDAPITTAGGDAARDPWAEFSGAYNQTAPSAAGNGDDVLGFVEHMNHAFQRMAQNPVSQGIYQAFPGLRPTGHGGVNDYVAQETAKGKTPGAFGGFMGDAVGSSPAMVLPGGPLVQGAASGLITGDSKTPLELLADATGGAVSGAVGGRVAKAFAGAAAPSVDKNVDTLLNAGVPLTPGQMASRGFHRLEDGLESIPMLGDMIQNAKARSAQGFNRAVINDALSHTGDSLPPNLSAGREAVDYAHRTLSNAYDDLLPKLKLQADPQLHGDILTSVNNARGVLTPERSAQLEGIIKSRVLPRFGPGGTMTGDAMKDVDSQLGHLSRKFSASPDPDHQAVGEALDDVQQNLRDFVSRQNPAHAPQLADINAGWAKLKRVERAASSLGAKEGVFSAPQFSNAVKTMAGRDSQYARRGALMQDLADAGSAVLPSKVPDSGSPYRHALEAFVALGVGKEAKILNLPTMAAAALPTLAYTKGAQPVLQAAMTRRPNWSPAVRSFIERYGVPPAVTVAGALGGPAAQGMSPSQ